MPGLASSLGSGYCCGIQDGNHRSGIRNGGIVGTAGGGTGGFSVTGGFSCLVVVGVPVGVMVIGGSSGVIIGGLVVSVRVTDLVVMGT